MTINSIGVLLNIGHLFSGKVRGLSVGELLALRWNEVDFAAETIRDTTRRLAEAFTEDEAARELVTA